MTPELFNNLSKNTSVFLYQEPNIHFYSSFNAKIEKKVIEDKIVYNKIDENGKHYKEVTYLLTTGGILLPAVMDRLYLSMEEAVISKISKMSDLLNNIEDEKVDKEKLELKFKKILKTKNIVKYIKNNGEENEN